MRQSPGAKPRHQELHNIHTGEHLSLRYSSKGIWRDGDLERISYFLRCHYTNGGKAHTAGSGKPCSAAIRNRFGSSREVKIISGFRSRQYNEYLRCTGHCVAKESLHLQGRAIDFFIPGHTYPGYFPHGKAPRCRRGGKYPGFVHIDNGRVRCW